MAKKAAKPGKSPATSPPGTPDTPVSTPPLNERPVPVNPPSVPSKDLQVFENPSPQRDYLIQFQVPEFTCHCPLTGQPDFAHFTIDMIAGRLCVELKKFQSWHFLVIF